MSDSSEKTSRRDPFLDNWRGIFHLVMLVDHLPFLLPGIFTIIASFYEIAGYVTVAEGFVYLSGFVSGIVYTRIKRQRGDVAMWRKAVARASAIYFSYFLATVVLLGTVRLFGSSRIDWGSWNSLLNEPLGTASLQVAALLRQPMFLEILPMYSGLVLLTPFLVGQLEKGRYIIVLLISTAIWAGAQFNARNFLLSLFALNSVVHPGYFNALSWQLLFVAGLICGHKSYVTNGRWLPTGWFFPIVAYSAVCILFFMHHGLLGLSVNRRWTDRATVAPLRLLDFFCIVFLVSKFRTKIEKLIAWRGFAFLSKHSLQVFGFHLFPIYLVTLVLLGRRDTFPVWLQLVAVGLCVSGLFVIAFAASCAKSLQRRFSSPASDSPAKLAADSQ